MAQDAENTKIDLTQLDGMTDEQWKEMANGDPNTARLLKEMYESTTRLKEQVAKDASEKKTRETKSVVKKLEDSLERTPKGIMKDAVDFANTGQSPVGTADPAAMLEVIARGFEMCPGVTVDRDEFVLGEHHVQLILTLYNLPETRSISQPKVRKSTATELAQGDGKVPSPADIDQELEEDDENEDETAA